MVHMYACVYVFISEHICYTYVCFFFCSYYKLSDISDALTRALLNTLWLVIFKGLYFRGMPTLIQWIRQP